MRGRFKIHPPVAHKTLKEVWGPLFRHGKIRAAFSQSRGGFAVFVSGRMVGELFDAEEQAIAWLKRLGVRDDRVPNPKQKQTQKPKQKP